MASPSEDCFGEPPEVQRPKLIPAPFPTASSFTGNYINNVYYMKVEYIAHGPQSMKLYIIFARIQDQNSASVDKLIAGFQHMWRYRQFHRRRVARGIENDCCNQRESALGIEIDRPTHYSGTYLVNYHGNTCNLIWSLSLLTVPQLISGLILFRI